LTLRCSKGLLEHGVKGLSSTVVNFNEIT